MLTMGNTFCKHQDVRTKTDHSDTE